MLVHLTAGKGLKKQSKNSNSYSHRKRIFDYIASRVLYFELVVNMVFHLMIVKGLPTFVQHTALIIGLIQDTRLSIGDS